MKYINKMILIFIICCAKYKSSQASDLVVPAYSLLNQIKSIQFQPADEFSGPEMVGVYLKDKATATISDPLKITNTCTFTFTDVRKNNLHDTDKLQFIGSYTPKNTMNSINLYGILE